MKPLIKLSVVTLASALALTVTLHAAEKSANKKSDSKPVTVVPVVQTEQPVSKPVTDEKTTVSPVSAEQSTPIVPLASSRTGEQIKWQVISGGGGRGTSTNYVLSSTLGQTAVGPGMSSSYKVNHGFWQNFSPAGCCVATVGNTDCSPDDAVDISDLTILIDHLFINNTPLCCTEEGNVDGDLSGGVDISDLTVLIDHLFINNNPLPACL